ncbi:MAG: hypothetical protein KBT00_02900 [Bacteroidales bacterium]|nr:hypothetical protein [Candidatus Cacconaster merdequi]
MDGRFNSGLTPVGMSECAFILGGVDKRAQDALYTIGYIIGMVVKFVVALFSFNKTKEVL